MVQPLKMNVLIPQIHRCNRWSSGMDKQFHPKLQWCNRWKWMYLFIPQIHRCNRWSSGMDKQFHPTLYNGCYYLFVLGLQLDHVNIWGPCYWCKIIHLIKPCQTLLAVCCRSASNKHWLCEIINTIGCYQNTNGLLFVWNQFLMY